ncbi:similar to Saccharomyces cerevisiae YOR307C SLY41 Protein involved in ER-to-Golgi transport [Maudiozyma saulgeensis]|uniref:Similar to Saccharomyces cerevisiae YOR307C SLY41 Protein involved in ER-to-Golgi transport n=1 Tax=Maudiozyma saulgeensis TaxID=1789683 RepID=A0A1X7R4N8_9SACH|nr:similar to Saccharomyces cerevisiae YOR307C SLY41 Protein involved in ER-to-Golgi transport [Kazachstania saulgeensis]
MSSIETNGVTSVTKKRRGSTHKNLFDSDLYSIPNEPNSLYQQRKAEKLRNTHYQSHGSVSSQLADLWKSLISFVPKEYTNQYDKDFWPEINTKVVILCFLWYVTSSISSNLAKAILKRFTHPVALTELQFLVSAILCLSFACLVNLFQRPELNRGGFAKTLQSFPKGILPTYMNGNFNECIKERFLKPDKLILMTTFPLGAFQFVGHITSHKATSLVSISLVHSIKSLSPIITVAYYATFEKRKYKPLTYYTLGLLIIGVMITCWSSHNHQNKTENKNNGSVILLGIIYSFISTIIFVTQNIFAKGVLSVKLQKEGVLSAPSRDNTMRKHEKYTSTTQIDKITILFYCSCMGFLLTLGPFLTNELWHGSSLRADMNMTVFLLTLFHGITHFIQAMLAFQLIGLLSTVNYSVANIMKRIVIISVALVWESHLSFMQFFGLLLTVMGLYGYDRWGLSHKESRQL